MGFMKIQKFEQFIYDISTGEINESNSGLSVFTKEKMIKAENAISKIIDTYGISRINDTWVNVKYKKYYVDGAIKANITDNSIKFEVAYRGNKPSIIDELSLDGIFFVSNRGRFYLDVKLNQDSLIVNGTYHVRNKESNAFYEKLKKIITIDPFSQQISYNYFDEMERDLKTYITKYGIRKLNGKTLDNDSHFNLALEMTSQRCYIKHDDTQLYISFPYSNSIANYITKKTMDKYEVRYHDSDDGILFNVYEAKENPYNGKMFQFGGGTNYYSNFNDFLKFKDNMINFIENKGLDEWSVNKDDINRGIKNLRNM